MNSLLASWNFDIVSGSDGDGKFIVPDVSNQYSGSGIDFVSDSHEFVLKEEIKTNKNSKIDSLESIDSIQTADEFDENRRIFHNPSSVQLQLENSMYQTVSDEMLNMFSTISAYAFRFAESADRYRDQYDNLNVSKAEFFSKVLNNPDLEKYLEFYKWIDSSLGDLLNRLTPESSNNSRGLKNTVESHILERNKFKHKIPLTIEPNRTFSSNLRSIKKFSGTFSISSSFDNRANGKSDLTYVTSSIQTADISYEPGVDYTKNYQILQTAGKLHNHRNSSLYGRENKTVFQSRFSSVDGLSDKISDRDVTGEYSVYNNLNFRAQDQKIDFNYSQSLPLGRADKPRQGVIGYDNFRDNHFVERNIPYTASNYSNAL